MSSLNVLFFSNHCPGSQTLIILLKNEGLLRFFHTICTDNNPNVPPLITVTPTLIIRNIPVPYVAGDAFAWLNKVKQWKISMQMQKMSGLQQQYLQRMAGNLGMNTDGAGNVLGFSQEEMSGMSDIFAYLQGDNAIQHSYFDCVNLGKESICAPDKKDTKISEKSYHEISSKMEADRKKQDAEFKKNIEAFRNQYN
jgi:hypothetical protein